MNFSKWFNFCFMFSCICSGASSCSQDSFRPPGGRVLRFGEDHNMDWSTLESGDNWESGSWLLSLLFPTLQTWTWPKQKGNVWLRPSVHFWKVTNETVTSDLSWYLATRCAVLRCYWCCCILGWTQLWSPHAGNQNSFSSLVTHVSEHTVIISHLVDFINSTQDSHRCNLQILPCRTGPSLLPLGKTSWLVLNCSWLHWCWFGIHYNEIVCLFYFSAHCHIHHPFAEKVKERGSCVHSQGSWMGLCHGW